MTVKVNGLVESWAFTGEQSAIIKSWKENINKTKILHPLAVDRPPYDPHLAYLIVAHAAFNSLNTDLFEKQPRELLPTIVNAEPVGRIDDPDQGISLLEVIPPVCAQCLLASDIPYATITNQ
ncbi:MAG: hypothetical protein Q9177_003944 [Variospora cf. flavescens]